MTENISNLKWSSWLEMFISKTNQIIDVAKKKGALYWRFFPGRVGTFSRNAILVGDQISWRSLLQRTLQVPPWFWTFSPLWYFGIKYYNKINMLVLIRINDLSKEAILQCINEGDLRFLTVTWSTKIIPFMNTLFSYSDWWQWL